MTPKQFTDDLPILTVDPLPIKPPFEFTGLSARVFPLHASLDSLQQLVNGYLNFMPPEVGRFRVSAPYVYLSILDYGEISEVVSSIGWMAQVEVFFCVPLEWYKLVDGTWHFHDIAVITPFIYVNDDISVPMGRTVYGFPKALARLKPLANRWVSDPIAPVTLAELETAVFPELYMGKRLETRTFIEVERQPPVGNMQVPFNMNSPIMPWTIASNMAESMGGFGRDAMWMAQASRIFPTGPQFLPEMIKNLLPALSPTGPGFLLNSLNLKQFRRSDKPEDIAYQALTNGAMQPTAFNGGGVLGEQRMMMGDMSGGYSVRIHDYKSQPIVQALGLDVHRRWEGDGAEVAELKPVMPIWMDTNVRYREGQNVAWRAQDGIWKDGAGVDIPTHTAKNHAKDLLFNTTVTSVVDDIAGPFEFADTTVRVLPLLAEKKKLEDFLNECVNRALPNTDLDPEGKADSAEVRLSVWSRPAASVRKGGRRIGGNLAYVYLTASSFSGVTSKSNNVGDWAKYDLSFLIPVKWERKVGSDWVVQGVGMYPAYNFVDDTIAAISRLEVQGISTQCARFIRSDSVWLSRTDSFTESPQSLLKIQSEVIPALGVGQETSTQTVIEISSLGSSATRKISESPEAAARLAEMLRLELGTKKGTKAFHSDECKSARALALELLGNQVPFETYTLKQFRDVADPAKACFQSLQRLPRIFREVTDMREIEETLAVRLYDFPTLKIAESLGLVVTSNPKEGPGLAYTAQAVRPFYIRGTLEEGLGVPLLTRAGIGKWQLSEHAFDSLLTATETESDPQITVNPLSEKLQDQADPHRMSAVMYEALQVRNQSPGEPISEDKARDAIKYVDPQMVIDALLSREWGNADENARWRRGRRELLASYDGLFADYTSGYVADAESVLYSLAYERMASRPGSPEKLMQAVKDAIAQLGEFTGQRSVMEQHFSVLAAWSVLRLQGEATDTMGIRRVASPAGNQLLEGLRAMLGQIKHIHTLEIEGEPSSANNLYPKVLGDRYRLKELIDGPLKNVEDILQNQTLSEREKVEQAWLYLDPIRQAVELARSYCDAQRDALLNKLSRVYQKPDFCIRRDAVGPERDTLLPITLSWDENWYYGKKIE